MNEYEKEIFSDDAENKNLRNVKFIVFEGPDCCGKSTQVDNLINKHLAQQHDVVLKIHFPFNSLNNDQLKDNYEELMQTVYNRDFMKPENFDKDRLFTALKKNVIYNSYDKEIFLNTLFRILNKYENPDVKFTHGKVHTNGCSINDLLTNKNCEIWFNGYSVNTSNKEEIKIITEFFRITDTPDVCIVFDRFIISGMIYNYFLPKSVMNVYFNSGDIDLSLKPSIDEFFENLKLLQTERTAYEMDGFDELTNYIPFDFAIHGRLNYCDPKVLWFIFAPSERIYETFLKDESRKKEAYDINNMLRTIVNDIYFNITYYGNDSGYLLNNIFNMKAVDTDDFIAEWGLENSKEKITEYIFNESNFSMIRYNKMMSSLKDLLYYSYKHM